MIDYSLFSKYAGLREKLKAVVNVVQSRLEFSEAQSLNTFISMVPAERETQVGDNMDFNFHKTTTYNLLDFHSVSKSDTVFESFGIAAKLFINSSNVVCTHYKPPTIYSSLNFGLIEIPSQETTVFLVKEESQMFKSYYDNAEDFFNYMLGEGFADSDLNTGFVPSDYDISLAYYYLRYGKINKNCVFAFVNSGFVYSGNDFSEAAKQYIKRRLLLTFESIGVIGADAALNSVDIFPYDFYFEKYAHKSHVSFFINRIAKCANEHTLNIQNVGKLIEPNINRIISMFAFASNNYVGTKYRNESISALQHEFALYPKPIIIDDAPYQHEQYIEMFAAFSKAASNNLSILKSAHINKSLVTSEWLYSNIGNTDGFDNTFICFGYLKLVEILLSTILLRDYSGTELPISWSKSIVIEASTEHMLMLGNMINFVINNPASPIRNSKYRKTIETALNDWKNHIRNGYFHKDSLEKDTVTEIRNKTFEVIYMILGALPKERGQE